MTYYLVKHKEELAISRNVICVNECGKSQRLHAYDYYANLVSIPYFSYHAATAGSTTWLSPEDIVYILCYGRRYHDAMSRLIGTAVIVNKDHSTIITIWRNRQHGVRNIRRKLAAVWYRGNHHQDEL